MGDVHPAELQEILRPLEESFWRAATRFDPEYMERVLAPDFVECGRSGRRYTRRQIIDMTWDVKIEAKLPLPEFAARMVGSDLALVTYVSEVRYETLERGNRSSLWRRVGDSWQLVFHQGTPVTADHDTACNETGVRRGLASFDGVLARGDASGRSAPEVEVDREAP